jgi:hypothetical protein
MGNQKEIRILLGSLRYKSAVNLDYSIKVPFIQTGKELTEYDRSVDIDLQEVFDRERQKSNSFRPSCKLSFVFKNSYTGFSTYSPYINSLYYVNSSTDAQIACSGGTSPNLWAGFPRYDEFSFIRTDNNFQGYTSPDNNVPPEYHELFKSKSATSYNWGFYMSYAFENITNQNLSCTFQVDGFNYTLNWNVSDGIPFVIKDTTFNGRTLISFVCPMKHGLSVGEFVQLSFDYNGNNLFQIYSLGDGKFETDEYIFNIINVGFLGTTFDPGTQGTAKRVILQNGVTETTSKYYIRSHRILNNSEDFVLVNSGFETNVFQDKKRIDFAATTPNQIERISVKEGSQSYTLSFNKDFDLNKLVDNQLRPVSEIFVTIIWKGYFGWTLPIKWGFDFNLQLLPSFGVPTTWWATLASNETFTTSNYNNTNPYPYVVDPAGAPYNFTYTNSLVSGDTINGDLCEWNDYTQTERVISHRYHKIKFNQNNFNCTLTTDLNATFEPGYYYQPLFSIPVRAFSDYLEEGDPNYVVDVPNYATFSENRNTFVWKDLYPYGFIDTNGIGVDQPFLNGKHHPFRNIIFRLIPEGTNYKLFNDVGDPLIDPCE